MAEATKKVRYCLNIEPEGFVFMVVSLPFFMCSGVLFYTLTGAPSTTVFKGIVLIYCGVGLLFLGLICLMLSFFYVNYGFDTFEEVNLNDIVIKRNEMPEGENDSADMSKFLRSESKEHRNSIEDKRATLSVEPIPSGLFGQAEQSV